MATRFKRTNIPNLDHAIDYGTYYGRVKLHGKLIRERLAETKRAAEQKLPAWLVSKRGERRTRRGTLNSLTERYLIRLAGKEATGDLDEESTKYKKECLAAIRGIWPEFGTVHISKLERSHLEAFRVKYRTKYLATRTNGAITVLREFLELAEEDGFISHAQKEDLLKGFTYVKVDYDYKRMTMDLPEPPVVVELRSAVRRRCQMRGTQGQWLFDFLLFSGSRIEAANEVWWEDIDWKKGSLYFRDAKYGNYTIPLFPELRKCLEDLRKATPNAKPADRVLPTKSLQSVLTSACVELQGRGLKCPHLSHHDLRHLFATRAIEQGVDWVTLAAWLGHRDNGRTAMLIYGHLRKSHSESEASRMQFLPSAQAPEKPTPPPAADGASAANT
jgi:integrase